MGGHRGSSSRTKKGKAKKMVHVDGAVHVTKAPPSKSRGDRPSIQEQLKTVSFLARVTSRPDAPCICACARREVGFRPCAAFGCFCGVPVDVMLLLLAHLRFDELLRMGLLNAKWHSVAASEHLWRPLCLAKWPDLGDLGEGVRDWRLVYALWHKGAASDMLRLMRFCPLAVGPPDRAELKRWYKQWKMNRRLNTCPYGGVAEYRATPLSDLQSYPTQHVVMRAAFERCRSELLAKHRCKVYEHELYVAVTRAQLRQISLHGFGVVNQHLTCRPHAEHWPTGEARVFDNFDTPESRVWLSDFFMRLQIKSSGAYEPRESQLVANTDTPGVYAFWYNPARAIRHAEVGATHLLCMTVLVHAKTPHPTAIANENEWFTYSMSPLCRESVMPKWVAEIGSPYEGPYGWAMLEYEYDSEDARARRTTPGSRHVYIEDGSGQGLAELNGGEEPTQVT